MGVLRMLPTIRRSYEIGISLQNSDPEKHHLQLHEPGVECNL